MPADSVALFDDAVRRRIALERYSNDQIRKTLPFLKEVERDLIGRIAQLRAEANSRAGQIRLASQERLLASIQSVYAEAYGNLNERLQSGMTRLAGSEAARVSEALADAAGSAGLQFTTNQLTATSAFEIAAARPMQGAMLKDWLDDLEPSHRRRLEQSLRISFAEGESLETAINRIRDATTLNERGLAALIRTSNSHIAAAVTEATYEANADIIEGVEWVSTLDARTTPICRARDGKRYKVGEGPRPPAHIGCLPGDALVSSGSGVTGAFKRWYDGNLIVIGTASGKQFSCTPNHPILTDAGWVAAGLLDVGGHVVCNAGIDRVAPFIDAHDKDIEARIEDAAEAIFANEQMATVPVPTTAEDFHGDGMDDDIAVVAINRDLRSDFEAAFSERLGKRDFKFGRVGLACLSGFRGALQSFVGVWLSALGLVGRFSKALPLAGGCYAHPGGLLFTSVSKGQAGAGDGFLHRVGREPHAVAYASYTYAGLEKSNHAARVKIGALHGRPDDFDASGDKRIAGGLLSDTEMASHILDGSAGPIALDEIVSVRSEAFAGHVFNLETEDGWYIANGIITHNCRSTTIAVLMGMDPLPRETYSQWLKRQPAATQDDILGPARGKLFRDGALSVDRFTDMKGKALTLEELGYSSRDPLFKNYVAQMRTPGAQAAAKFLATTPEETGRIVQNLLGEAGPLLKEEGRQSGALLSLKITGGSNKAAFSVIGDGFRMEREFVRRGGELQVDNKLLSLHPSLQGKGYGTKILQASVQEYKRLGVTRMNVTANIDIGGYTWAKMGYAPKSVAAFREAVMDVVDEKMASGVLTSADKQLITAALRAGAANPKRLPATLAKLVNADGKQIGKEALLGSYWEGYLDLTDADALAFFEKMVSATR